MVFGQYFDKRIVLRLSTFFVVGLFIFLTATQGLHAASPTADYIIDDNRDGSVDFDASVSMDPDGDIEEYVWEFDDGEFDDGIRVTHCFPEEGTYEVMLTVSDRTSSHAVTKPIIISHPATCNDRQVGSITNPLGDLSTIPEFLEALLDRIVQIAIPIIIVFIIYAGFLFLTAQGNPEKISKAKKTLMWTLIGAAVIIGADLLAKVIVGTITDLGQ